MSLRGFFFFNNMHIYLLSQGDLSVYSGSEWRQTCDSVSSISIPTRADAEEQDEGAVLCPLWSFCWIPVPMADTLKPQMQQDQTEPPTPFKQELFSHHTVTILALLTEAGSKAVLNPVFCHHLHQPFPPIRWQNPERGPCLCTIGMWPWRSDIIAKAVKTVFILPGYFPSHF